jgi:hypothetical protein
MGVISSLRNRECLPSNMTYEGTITLIKSLVYRITRKGLKTDMRRSDVDISNIEMVETLMKGTYWHYMVH